MVKNFKLSNPEYLKICRVGLKFTRIIMYELLEKCKCVLKSDHCHNE